jgi:transposase
MTDILDLPGWTPTNVRVENDEYVIEAEYTVLPEACQKCGVIGRLYKHGPKAITFRDSPIRGRPVNILASAKRYKCRECEGTFIQPLGGIYPSMRMTERCVQFVKAQCLLQPFVQIADTVGCDEKTVRTLAAEHIAHVDGGYLPALPEWLGIDETQIHGKLRLVLTDVGRRKPIEMLPERDKGTLAGWLNRYKDRSMVKGVAIDMWRPYRDTCHLMLPGIPVVVDKFHVVRTANYCMERVRIRLQKAKKAGVRRDWLQSKHILNMRAKSLTEKQRFNRDMWLDNEPELADAYRLKEAFYAIYDMPKERAIEAFDAYARTVPSSLKADFKVLLTSMKNWRTEILAYFDHPITNAYTEALNGVAKAVNRAGRGYSFDVLRARILLRTPGRKAEPGSRYYPVVPHNGPGSASPSMVVKCMSCGGLYDKRIVAPGHFRPIAGRERVKNVLVLCRTCNARFHTE